MIVKLNSDKLGIAAGGLCLIRCAATPFLFIVKACSISCCANAATPVWWGLIDYVFLLISFIAIYYATANSTKKWVRTALWSSWMLLSFMILNETLEKFPLPEWLIYFPAILIVTLHIYNMKYGKCKSHSCSVN
jgi:hypothetical protein